MTSSIARPRPLLGRIAGRIARFFVGDRILMPRRMADTTWHLQSVRHRIRGGQIIVRFDNIEADLVIDARSDLTLRALSQGSYEPELTCVLPSLCGSGDLVNVGANVGIVAVVLAGLLAPGRRLLCIEPIAECVDLLRTNVRTVGAVDTAIVVEAFASETAGRSMEIWTVPGKPEYSSGGSIVHAAVAAEPKVRRQVSTIRLDDVIAEWHLSPSAIVMDCEGGEYEALRGARATVEKFQPCIILEFDGGLLKANDSDPAALIEFLAGLGYRGLRLDGTGGTLDPGFSGTVVAVPVERLDDVRQVLREKLHGQS